MRVELTREDCYCSLPDFYRNVAKKMCIAVDDSTHFDCRKICITRNVQNELWAYYYEEERQANMQIATLFLSLGPKANLEDRDLYYAEVKRGFITK